MPALAFLFICFCFGALLLRLGFRGLFRSEYISLTLTPSRVWRPFVVLPGSLCLGMVSLGWCAWLISRALAFTGDGLFWGARITLGLAFFVCAGAFLFLYRRVKPGLRRRATDFFRGFGLAEALVLLFALAAGALLSFFCFWEDADSIRLGVNIFSDFSPHIAVIQSFAEGNNFPTQYPHFPDGTIRYHFMFLFFAAVLEELGLPLTLALNLPSLLCFAGLVLLLYSLAMALTGRRRASLIFLLLFFFRSGLGVFTLLSDCPEGTSPFRWLLQNKAFFGPTLHEDWGLFAQNVYANQRHLSLGMSLVVLCLLWFWPLFTEGFLCWRKAGRQGFWRAFLFDAQSWLSARGFLLGLPAGLLLGAAAFWHGSMVICTLLILAGLGVFSRHRLTYLGAAVPAVALSSLQSRVFTGGASPLHLSVQIGFLADSSSPADIARYLLLLTGLYFFAAAAALWLSGPAARAYFGAVLLPLILAFTVQMTPDIAVAHKQVMLSLILGGVPIALLLDTLSRSRRWALRVLAGGLALMMTVTGAEELVTYCNLSRSHPMVLDKNDPLLQWVRTETPVNSCFLSGYLLLSPVFTAGRFCYQGWPYFAWSAGYDTIGRDRELKEIFACREASVFAQKARATGADYLLVNQSLTEDERFKDFFEAGYEVIIAESFPLVYEDRQNRVYQLTR